MTTAKKPWYKHVWILRLTYIAGALLSLPAMGWTIGVVSELSGLDEWSRVHGPFFILNEVTGPGVMMNFIVILFFIGLCMFFIFRAFSTTEEMPID